MGLYDHWPYTNFHELNLSWLLRRMEYLSNVVENFVALNTIKYADPIQWNITSQYEANTVVVDPQSGTAYISTKPVPAGVAINNTYYWSVIFTLDMLSANDNITLRDDGSNVLSTFTSNEGDWLLWNGDLYRVSQNINLNEAYVPGYNLDRYTVEMFIRDYVNEILTVIGDLDDLTTTDKDSIVDAINELVSSMGDLSSLTTTDKDSIVNAINELVSRIGDLNDLNTTDKDSIVDAINEVLSDISGVISSTVYTAPEFYGSVGDGVADDTEAVQAAIDDAINNKKMLLLTKTYLVNTLFINNAIEICGGGTLKGQPLRYDTTGSDLTNTDRFFTTTHPEYYHKNTIITVHDSNNTQTFVVDDVEGNNIYVEPHFYEAGSTAITTFPAGAVVNIHTEVIEISASNQHLAADTIIKNINIHDIHIKGSQLGYDNTKYVIFDGRYNGLIFAHSIAESTISNNILNDAISNIMTIMGTCTKVIVDSNRITNCHSLFESSSETECGIVFHWSQRFIGATYTPSHCIISNNIVNDCYDGIFMSACTYFTVIGNNINDIIYRGLMIYAGDNSYPNRNHVVTGNTLRNCAQSSNNIAALYLSGIIQSVISSNNIVQCTNGITIGKGDDLEIADNEIMAFSHYGIADYHGYKHNIKSNYFVATTGAIAHIFIDNDDVGNNYIYIEGNVYNGANSSGAAIKVDHGLNIKIMNDALHASPSYLIKPDTANISLGDILIMNCYVNSGVALSAELAVLKYRDCINSSNALVNNIT